MMSLRAVHGSHGYAYLLRSVATNDALDEAVAKEGALHAYYAAKGTPPGRWIGAGLPGFNSESIVAGKEISGEQMAALFGLAVHPDFDALVAAGSRPEELRLGRPLMSRSADAEIQAIMRVREEFARKNGRVPTMDDADAIFIEALRPFRPNAQDHELASIGRVKMEQEERQPVVAFDMTFCPVKSISVAWALSDEETSSAIQACHDEAVAEAMRYFESEVLRTRIGAQGALRVATKGAIAASFTHFDTRNGDPDLHSHVLVSNRVQTTDGKWLTVDGTTLFRNHQAVSAFYDAVLQAKLAERVGFDFATRPENEVVEIAGVSQELCQKFSSRRVQAEPVFHQLCIDFRAKNGRSPDVNTMKKLWQQAILETRQEKGEAHSLQELRSQWSEQSQGMGLWSEDSVERNPAFDVEVSVENVVDKLASRRSVFRRNNIEAAIFSELKRCTFHDAEELEVAVGMLREGVQKRLIPVGSEQLDLPSALVNHEGIALDRDDSSQLFALPEVLEAEQTVLNAMDEPTAVFVPTDVIDAVLAEHEAVNGWSLNHGQEAMARHILQNGALVSCGVGLAGSGKTTSMQIVAKAMNAMGKKVIGLAPSAKAAELLGEEIGTEALTIDKLTFVWKGKHPHLPGGDVKALPVEINPGDVLLVDEAGMASTANLAALVEIAKESGAVIRAIGDPGQLSAIQQGGLFKTMVQHDRTTVALTRVMRFHKGKDEEQALASMQVREGNADGLGLYFDRGWVHDGTREAMIDKAVVAYLHDLDEGKKSIVIASTNHDVARINAMIREVRIDRGLVDSDTVRTGSMGDSISPGDLILARENTVLRDSQGHPVGKLVNGQQLVVMEFREDSVLVSDAKTGTLHELSAEYFSEHCHLGYAATVHRAQGVTVDTCHAVTDSGVDRAGLYVALTRGKQQNHAWVVTETEQQFDLDAEEFHSQPMTHSERSARDVLEECLQNDRNQRSITDEIQRINSELGSEERKQTLFDSGLVVARDAFIEALAAEHDVDVSKDFRTSIIRLLRADLDPRIVLTSAELRDSSVLRTRVEELTEGFSGDLRRVPPLWSKANLELQFWLAELDATLHDESQQGEVIEDTSFDEVEWLERDFSGTTFKNCVFSVEKITDCDFSGCTFIDCEFTSEFITRTNFDGATFSGAIFKGEPGIPINLTACDFRNTSILGTFKSAVVTACEFGKAVVHAALTFTTWSLNNEQDADIQFESVEWSQVSRDETESVRKESHDILVNRNVQHNRINQRDEWTL